MAIATVIKQFSLIPSSTHSYCFAWAHAEELESIRLMNYPTQDQQFVYTWQTHVAWHCALHNLRHFLSLSLIGSITSYAFLLKKLTAVFAFFPAFDAVNVHSRCACQTDCPRFSYWLILLLSLHCLCLCIVLIFCASVAQKSLQEDSLSENFIAEHTWAWVQEQKSPFTEETNP